MAPSLDGGGVEVHTFVGKRMDVRKVLRGELCGGGGGGGESMAAVVVLVSGPSEMADEARGVVCGIGRRRGGVKVRLVEEAFSW